MTHTGSVCVCVWAVSHDCVCVCFACLSAPVLYCRAAGTKPAPCNDPQFHSSKWKWWKQFSAGCVLRRQVKIPLRIRFVDVLDAARRCVRYPLTVWVNCFLRLLWLLNKHHLYVCWGVYSVVIPTVLQAPFVEFSWIVRERLVWDCVWWEEWTDQRSAGQLIDFRAFFVLCMRLSFYPSHPRAPHREPWSDPSPDGIGCGSLPHYTKHLFCPLKIRYQHILRNIYTYWVIQWI